MSLPFLPVPLMAAVRRAPKTYAQFQAHIAALTGSTRSSSGTSNSPGQFRVTVVTPIGGMSGSSWGPGSPNGFTQGGSTYLGRIVQHAMPSEDVFSALIASASEVCMTIVTVSTPAAELNSVTRNGFTSTYYAGGGAVANAVSELLLFHPTDGPVRMFPNLGLGPSPYDWDL